MLKKILILMIITLILINCSKYNEEPKKVSENKETVSDFHRDSGKQSKVKPLNDLP